MPTLTSSNIKGTAKDRDTLSQVTGLFSLSPKTAEDLVAIGALESVTQIAGLASLDIEETRINLSTMDMGANGFGFVTQNIDVATSGGPTDTSDVIRVEINSGHGLQLLSKIECGDIVIEGAASSEYIITCGDVKHISKDFKDLESLFPERAKDIEAVRGAALNLINSFHGQLKNSEATARFNTATLQGSDVSVSQSAGVTTGTVSPPQADRATQKGIS